MPKTFASVLLHTGGFEGELPVEIVPGYLLRRATPDEVEHIRRVLVGYTGVEGTYGLPYEWEFVPDAERPGNFRMNELPPDALRYHVISCHNTGEQDRIQSAANVSGVPIEIGFTLQLLAPIGQERPVGVATSYTHASKIFFAVSEKSITDIHVLTAADVHKVRVAYDLLRKHDESVLPLASLLADYEALKALPETSRLRLLGYFGLVEALATHAPRKEDPYDSLTRQICVKVELLRNRFSEPLDFASFFNGAKPDTALKKLYAFRSTIAHGNHSALDPVLRSESNVHDFMRQLVRRLFMCALEEPALMRDLQNC